MRLNRRNKAQAGLTAFIMMVAVMMPVIAQQKPYTVTNETELDGESFKGFQLFRNWCARCHGTYGQGLAAPNLAMSLNKMTKNDFMEIFAENTVKQHGNPGWSENQQVMKGREQIYRYLKARADGAIGALQPDLAK